MKRRKKKIKIKWVNVIKLIALIFCISMILYNLYMLTIYSWATKKILGFSWFGLITFILYCGWSFQICLDFKEEMEKTQVTGTNSRLTKI